MKQEKYKILVIVILLGICCFLTYYFHVVLETGVIFTHFFYFPILLSALWWKKKGLLVAIFLAALFIFGHYFLRVGAVGVNDYFRILMFMVVAIVVVSLSERIAKINQTLRESEEKFRTITSSAHDAIAMIDSEGKVVYWNEAAERMFKYPKQEIIGKELHAIIAPQQCYRAYKKGFSKFRLTGKGAAVGKTTGLTALRKDGIEFPVELSLSVVKIKGQ